MANIIFWAMLITACVIVFYKMYKAAVYNVAGVKMVKGELVQVMPPDHYTFFMTFFCYIFAAGFISIILYLASACLMDMTGYADKWGIQTGLQALSNNFGKG